MGGHKKSTAAFAWLKLRRKLSGFTLVELMLATSIFSTVLVVTLSGFVQIGRLYYKGVTGTRNQQTARAVVDSITNDIRYSSTVSDLHTTDDPSLGYICIGSARYTFNLHNKVDLSTPEDPNNNDHFGLIRDILPGFSGCGNPFDTDTSQKVPFASNWKELLGDRMRLNAFDVSSPPPNDGNVYLVSLDLVTGDDETLQIDPDTDVATCNSSLKTSQYCAQTALSTSVSVNTGAISHDARKQGITVTKTGKGHGTVSTDFDPKLDCGDLCQVVYDTPMNSVKVTASTIAGSYSVFSKWVFTNSKIYCKNGPTPGKNATTSTTNPCVLDVNGGIYLTAQFDCKGSPTGSCDFDLSLSKGGTGFGNVKSSDNKINCGSDCKQTYDIPTNATLTATPQSAISSFLSWNVNCKDASGKNVGNKGVISGSNSTCIVLVNKKMTVTANFKCNQASCAWGLTVTKTGSGDGTITSDDSKIDCGDTCVAGYDSAKTVILTATPDDISKFVTWDQNCITGGKKANPCKVNVNKVLTYKATFSCNQATCTWGLTVKKGGSGDGTIRSDDGLINCGDTCSTDYDSATTVELTAFADNGSKFVTWNQNCITGGKTANPCDVNVNKVLTYQATFNKK